MKKKNLSFMALFMLTTSLIAGCSCSNKKDNENVSNLVIKIGDKEYSAAQLYADLLSSGSGANEAFSKVLRLVIESSMETSTNIQAAADLAEENFEEDVTNDALTNGTSKDESRKKLLEEKGYNSVEEMKADIIYEQKLTRISENYWEENKGSYYNDFIANRLPYLVRHILIKTDDTNGNKIGNNVSISQSDGKKLYDVIKRFESGDKFSYIANQESEDTGSTANGGAYYMDNTYGANGFVDEFVYGTYAFDSYMTKQVDGETTTFVYGPNQEKISKLVGLSDTETFSEYYENGFNFVDMNVVNILGKVYNQTTLSNKDYFTIGVYNEVPEEEGEGVTYETASGNLNSSDNYYARSIIFNRVFNKPGVSVIGYNSKQEAIDAGAKYYVELKQEGKPSKFILTDENGNPIFFVAARGSSNDIWVHFLTINVSALDDLENAKKFFSLEQNSEDNYTTYVELMNTAGTKQNENNLISELEGYIRSYATAGTGNSVGEESLLNYDLVEYYMNKNHISYINDQLKNAIQSYVTSRRSYLKTKLLHTISDDWDTHTNKLDTNMSEFIQKGVKPFECAVLLSNEVDTRDNPYTALTTSDYLCRYVYGKGYQVQLSYYYETTGSSESSESFTKVSTNTSNVLWFDNTKEDPSENSGYVQYYSISPENNHIILAKPQVRDGYEFQGWYTDKNFEHRVPESDGKQYIDLSESRITNNTIFFAKVVAISATTINYIYQYANGTNVSSDIVNEHITSDGLTKSKVFDAGQDNTISFSTSAVVSDYVTATKFLKGGEEVSNITLTAEDYGKTIDIVVVVTPKETTITFKYVTSDGVETQEPTNKGSIKNKYSYDPSNPNVTINASDFTFADGKRMTGLKVAKNDEVYSEDLESELVLTESDMGQTITVYIVVGEGE